MTRNNNQVKILLGPAQTKLKEIASSSVDCVVTSPPYFNMRTYGKQGVNSKEIGQEDHPMKFVQHLLEIFREIYRVLKPTGTVFLNIGDSVSKTDYESIPGFSMQASFKKGKKMLSFKKGQQMLVPQILAIELRRLGFHIKQDIIWAKTNPIPSPAKSRFVASHEYIFFLTKQGSGYHFEPSNAKVIKDKKTTNKDLSSVWFETTSRCKNAHFAPYPENIVEYGIATGCPPKGVVLDPFSGSGTTMRVAKRLGRKFIGVELYKDYVDMHKV